MEPLSRYAFAALVLLVALPYNVSSQCINGTTVENTTVCDVFATTTTINATHDCCECESDFSGNGTTCVLAARSECSSSVGDDFAFKVKLNQTYIDYYNISTSSLRLINDTCNNVTLESGYYVLSSPTFDDCGSIRTNDSNNIIYTNYVTNDGGVSSGSIFSIKVQCLVSSQISITFTDTSGNPLKITVDQVSTESIIFPVQSATGTVSATMFLYKDTGYTQPYNGVPVLETTDMLYVQIALDNALTKAVMTARECWATPDPEGVSPERFNIIDQPGCLRSSVYLGKVTKNGKADVRFQLQVFTFLPSNVVYLHCQVELCTADNENSCQPACSSSRRRRSSSDGRLIRLLRSSLIIRSDHKVQVPDILEDDNQNNESETTNTIIYILVGVCGLLLIVLLFLVIGMLIWKKRGHHI